MGEFNEQVPILNSILKNGGDYIMSINKTAIVQKFFQLAGEGKWDEVEPFLHPDFELIPATCQPYAGAYRGLRGFQEIVHKIYNETYELYEPTVLEFTEGPHTVVVLISVKVTGKKTGQTITMDLVEALRFEEGKIRSIVPYYFDTKLLVEL